MTDPKPISKAEATRRFGERQGDWATYFPPVTPAKPIATDDLDEEESALVRLLRAARALVAKPL